MTKIGSATKLGHSYGNKQYQHLGSIYTPQEVASVLATWAIRSPHSTVLDLGVGGGSFVWSSYERLQILGADPYESQQQIYGSEIFLPAYNDFIKESEEKNLYFPNIMLGDFLSSNFPPVDAVVGNPPYVRRQNIEDIDSLRASITGLDIIDVDEIPSLSDLYIYFLLKSASLLKNGGKMGVIVADSWLNTKYGSVLKNVLLRNFIVEKIVKFDRNIFNVEVKTVMIFAIKKIENANHNVDFIRIKNGLPFSFAVKPVEELSLLNDTQIYNISQKKLKSNSIWGIYFRDTDLINRLELHPIMTSIKNIATTRIGIQTLAKDFFILSKQQIYNYGIEKEFIQPLLYSSRTLNHLEVQENSEIDCYLFYCNRDKSDMKNTRSLVYIEQAEKKDVRIRGKQRSVVGYQNKDRIKQANRNFWYDLKTDILRRGRAEILIPRLISENWNITWNKANFVPGEAFIEFIPHTNNNDMEVYLAVLSSSISEIIFRTYAQDYGGGITNLGLKLISNAPMIDINQISDSDKISLKKAYEKYIKNTHHKDNRTDINKIIYDILGLNHDEQIAVEKLLHDMRYKKSLSDR